MQDDPRRRTPRTDAVLADAGVAGRRRPAGPGPASSAAVAEVLDACRAGRRRPRRRGRRPCWRRLPASATVAAARSSTRPASWCTPTSAARRCRRRPSRRSAMAAGATDVELDLATGRRGPRGARRARRARRRRARRRRRPRRQQRRRRPGPGHLRAGRAAARSWSRAASWSRSATASGSPSCWSRSAPGCARSGRPTGCGSPTTRRAVGDRTPRSCSRCTRRTSGSRASPRRCRSPSSATLGVPGRRRHRLGAARARTRGCPTSRTPRPRCAPAPTWSPPPATSCSAARSAGCCSAGAELVRAAAARTRSPGRCASTS